MFLQPLHHHHHQQQQQQNSAKDFFAEHLHANLCTCGFLIHPTQWPCPSSLLELFLKDTRPTNDDICRQVPSLFGTIPTIDLTTTVIFQSMLWTNHPSNSFLAGQTCVRMIPNTSWCYMAWTGSVSGVARILGIWSFLPTSWIHMSKTAETRWS